MLLRMVAPVIQVKNVNKWFADLRVLRDVSLTVNRGDVTAIIGPSGAGKSTLCRTINRLETIDSGEILIDGEPLPSDAKGLARLRAKVGMVFQQFNLFEHRTVLENVTLGPIQVLGLPPDEAEGRALALLREVGVEREAAKSPGELSGGQKQRVAIARALAMDPSVLLFDEPTSALDPEMIAEVLDVMAALTKRDITMVVVTHELPFARRVAADVVFMADGEIVESAPPAEFFSAPRTQRARDFLASALPGSS